MQSELEPEVVARNRRSALSAILVALSIAFGAFGAHAMKDVLSVERLDVWKTASQYLGLQGVALLWLSKRADLATVWRLLAFGVLVFSGSLYALCLSGIGLFGAVTPVGGTMLIAGWLLTAWRLWHS